MAPQRLENPYEEQQAVLLTRIVGNVEKLNEALLELIKSLGEINEHNEQTALFTDMYAAYMRNVRFNLENQGERAGPQ